MYGWLEAVWEGVHLYTELQLDGQLQGVMEKSVIAAEQRLLDILLSPNLPCCLAFPVLLEKPLACQPGLL